MILAIGNSGCYETEAYLEVMRAVERRGKKMLLFKQDQCLKGEYLTYRVVGGISSYVVVIDKIEYDVNKFSTIWYMHPMLPKELLNHKQVEFRPFISAQFLEMRKALWYLLRHKKWLNDPCKASEAENKIFQLSVATQVGFEIPDTVITSDPENVRIFYDKHGGDIIVKTLAVSPIPDRVLYTNKVSPNQMATINSLRMSPSIFQENVAKEYELRITVVGDNIFPVKIHSQADERTSLDWRVRPKLNDFEVKMEQTTLPSHVESKIMVFMKEIGLSYGCIDMIVTRDGKYVFLEINPSGQWYFVQLRTGARIAEAIAGLLI